MHPELFLLVHNQRVRELEQLHARRLAVAERLALAPASRTSPVLRASAVVAGVTQLVSRLRTGATGLVPVQPPVCCPAA